MEEAETNIKVYGGEESKQQSSDMGHVTPSFPKEAAEFARTESDPALIKKKLFEITGEQATLQDVAELKRLIAKEEMEMSLASYTGSKDAYRESEIAEQKAYVSYLRRRAMTGDDEMNKYVDKNVSVLERMTAQNIASQNNVQVNFNVNEVLEAINGT